MINSNFFMGLPIPYKNICTVYPPKVKDIVSNSNYNVYRKLLLSSQEDIEDEWVEQKLPMEAMPTPLGYIFMLSTQDVQLRKIAQEAFEFFIHEPVLFLPDQKKVVIGSLDTALSRVRSVEDLRMIDDDNFFDLQNLIRESLGEKAVEPYNPNENPKIKYFKAKARLRDRVKAKSKDALNLGATLAIICCMNFGLNPLNIGELSQAAITVLIRYYQEKEKYETDIKALLAGADKKKVKPQTWIRNIEDL